MSKKKDENKTPAEAPETKFYLVILHPDGDLSLEEHDTLQELVGRIKALVNQDVSVFSFSGTQLRISKPPFRHLITPWGPQPLFELDDKNLEPDDTGYLGSDPIHLADPPVIKTPDASKALTNSADDFFDDESDATGLGVFDSVLPDPDA